VAGEYERKTAIPEKYIGVWKMRNGHNKRAPVRLGREARELYERTIEMYDITDPPSLLFLMNAALALDRLRAAERTVANEGSTFRDRFNQVKAHPACARIDCVNATIARCLRELGLDLSSAAVPGSGIPEGV